METPIPAKMPRMSQQDGGQESSKDGVKEPWSGKRCDSTNDSTSDGCKQYKPEQPKQNEDSKPGESLQDWFCTACEYLNNCWCSVCVKCKARKPALETSQQNQQQSQMPNGQASGPDQQQNANNSNQGIRPGMSPANNYAAAAAPQGNLPQPRPGFNIPLNEQGMPMPPMPPMPGMGAPPRGQSPAHQQQAQQQAQPQQQPLPPRPEMQQGMHMPPMMHPAHIRPGMNPSQQDQSRDWPQGQGGGGPPPGMTEGAPTGGSKKEEQWYCTACSHWNANWHYNCEVCMGRKLQDTGFS